MSLCLGNFVILFVCFQVNICLVQAFCRANNFGNNNNISTANLYIMHPSLEIFSASIVRYPVVSWVCQQSPILVIEKIGKLCRIS